MLFKGSVIIRLDVWGRGVKVLDVINCKKVVVIEFSISTNENLLKQNFEVCSASSTHVLTKIGFANRQTDTR